MEQTAREIEREMRIQELHYPSGAGTLYYNQLFPRKFGTSNEFAWEFWKEKQKIGDWRPDCEIARAIFEKRSLAFGGPDAMPRTKKRIRRCLMKLGFCKFEARRLAGFLMRVPAALRNRAGLVTWASGVFEHNQCLGLW